MNALMIFNNIRILPAHLADRAVLMGLDLGDKTIAIHIEGAPGKDAVAALGVAGIVCAGVVVVAVEWLVGDANA